MSLNFSVSTNSKMVIDSLKGASVIDPKSIKKALEASAKAIERRYKQLAKISKSGKGTGAYAEGIKVTVIDNDTIFVSSPTRNELASLNPNYSKDKAYYPAIQHYGSEARNIEANPIITDALDQASSDAINKFRTSLMKSINT